MPGPAGPLEELNKELETASRKARLAARVRASLLFALCLGLALVGLLAVVRDGGVVAWLCLVFFAACAAGSGYTLLAEFGAFGAGPGQPGRPSHRVSFDDRGIECRRAAGGAESVTWDGLRQVVLQAKDAFPVGDVYWLLIGEGESGCLVPIEAEGAGDLLDEMQRRLPGFDSEAVVMGMTMLDGSVVVWRQEDAEA